MQVRRSCGNPEWTKTYLAAVPRSALQLYSVWNCYLFAVERDEYDTEGGGGAVLKGARRKSAQISD